MFRYCVLGEGGKKSSYVLEKVLALVILKMGREICQNLIKFHWVKYTVHDLSFSWEVGVRRGRISTLVELLETEVTITWGWVRHPSCSEIFTEDFPVTAGFPEVYTHVQLPVSPHADPRFYLIFWDSKPHPPCTCYTLTNRTHSLSWVWGSSAEQS